MFPEHPDGEIKMRFCGFLFKVAKHYCMDIWRHEAFGPPPNYRSDYDIQPLLDDIELSHVLSHPRHLTIEGELMLIVSMVIIMWHFAEKSDMPPLWLIAYESGMPPLTMNPLIIIIMLGVFGVIFLYRMLPKDQSIPFRLLLDPRKIRFSQDSISHRFHDGSPVKGPPKSPHPKVAVVRLAQEGRGVFWFALNNRTLFNALYNGVGKVDVVIVDKPKDWDLRFTSKYPWICTTVRGKKHTEHTGYFTPCAANLPLSAQISEEPRNVCFVVLEARNLIKPQRSETLFSMLRDFDLRIYEVTGERSYARVRVDTQDTALIKNVIKGEAKKRGRKVEIREVEDQCQFESPRD